MNTAVPICLEDADNAIQLDHGRTAECTPHRHAELIAPHIGEARRNQSVGQPAARLAIRAIAIDNKCGALVALRESLHGGDLIIRWLIDDARTGDVTSVELRARPRIDDDGGSVCQNAAQFFGAYLPRSWHQAPSALPAGYRRLARRRDPHGQTTRQVLRRRAQ
ncbi:MAG TPA: hypothetical protein VH855_30095 [Acetobacteraceae bacterium]